MRILLLGGSSGFHGRTFLPTGLGLGGLAGAEGGGEGDGLMLTRFGFGMLSLHAFSIVEPSSSITVFLQLFAK